MIPSTPTGTKSRLTSLAPVRVSSEGASLLCRTASPRREGDGADYRNPGLLSPRMSPLALSSQSPTLVDKPFDEALGNSFVSVLSALL